MGVIGHNGGPALAPGASWRRHCWGKARRDLLPVLPIEVLRTRVARARELGLEYRTYAGVRAQTGQDVVAFLFSSNALRVSREAPHLPEDRAAKLVAVRAVARIGLAVAPLSAGALAENPELDAAQEAPWALAGFGAQARHLRAVLGRVPGDRVLLIGDHGLERDWCAAGRLAGYVPASAYFGG